MSNVTKIDSSVNVFQKKAILAVILIMCLLYAPQILGMTGCEEIMANGHSDYDLGEKLMTIAFKYFNFFL